MTLSFVDEDHLRLVKQVDRVDVVSSESLISLRPDGKRSISELISLALPSDPDDSSLRPQSLPLR